MFRDTTPRLVFELPFDAALLTDAGVTVSQRGAEVITKPFSELQFDDNLVTAKLTRADTRALDAEVAAEIQLWALCGDESLQSDIFRRPVERILKAWGDAE